MGFIEKRGTALPGQVPRPARSTAVQDLHLARPTPSGSSGRWRSTSSAGPGSTHDQRRDASSQMGGGVPGPRPPAVADDIADLPARPGQVRAAPLRLIPHRKAAGRRDRELAQRRGGRRHRPQLGPSPLPDTAADAPGGGREAEDPGQPVRPGPAAPCPEAGHGLPVLGCKRSPWPRPTRSATGR